MKTYLPKKEELKQNWYIIDAADKILGRLATIIAVKLRGKDKKIFTPHIDCGDNIIVINAEKIKVTGRKLTDKKYYKHTKFMGGLKEKSVETFLKERPEELLTKAVSRMLARNRMKRIILKKLRVYAGAEHPHAAQNPIELKINL